MKELTIQDLVLRVHQALVATGVELSPRDTAFAISLFLEGIALGGEPIPAVEFWLNSIADEVNRVKDES